MQVLLTNSVQTREDARNLWNAVPAVMYRCNEPATYRMPGAASAYSWLHFLDRYVRTWLALQNLVEQCFLPMGREGVRVLDVGTGPGPSSFATHDFYAAMVQYAEACGSEVWRQQARLSCVESAGAMNHFRHHLAEILSERGSPKSVLDMCGHLPDLGAIHPARERRELNDRLRKTYEDSYDEYSGQWDSASLYTPEEANYIANTLHRYRLFTFSNFFTTPSILNHLRANLIDILTDAHPGSVLLVISYDYQNIYKKVAALAEDAGFSHQVEHLEVSSSDTAMDEAVYSKGARFYRHLKYIAGDLPVDNPHARKGDPDTKKEMKIKKKVKRHFEGVKRIESPISVIRAHRK